MPDDLVGRDKTSAQGGGTQSGMSVEDLIAAKLRAKQIEDAEEARNAAKGGSHVSGGIGDIGGNLQAGGNVVGGDMVTGGNANVTTTTITSGIDGAALAQLVAAFKGIETKIDARPPDPNVDKAELKDTIKKVEEEVKKGEEANPTKVERWLKFLGDMAPDILQVTAATLANPVLGLSVAIKKIAEKAQGQATG